MILKTKETPLVRFRADLPKWLEPVGAAYIEIDARPAGVVNQVFLAGQDRIVTAQRIRDTAAADDTAKSAAAKETGLDWLGLVYDACVLGWRTNLIDAETNGPIEPTRATFMDLADVRIPHVTQMFINFQTAILKAGDDAAADDEATIKN